MNRVFRAQDGAELREEDVRALFEHWDRPSDHRLILFEGADRVRGVVEYPDHLTWPDGVRLWMIRWDKLRVHIEGFEELDKASVSRLVDYNGHFPAPPAPAYQIFRDGEPWVWLTLDDLITSGPEGLTLVPRSMDHGPLTEERIRKLCEEMIRVLKEA